MLYLRSIPHLGISENLSVLHFGKMLRNWDTFSVLFMHEKYQKCFYCGDLLIGRNSLLKLPDRNSALHPDLLALHAAFRHSMKSSYRLFTVYTCFQLKIRNIPCLTIENIHFLRPDFILQFGSLEPYGLTYEFAKRGMKF